MAEPDWRLTIIRRRARTTHRMARTYRARGCLVVHCGSAVERPTSELTGQRPKGMNMSNAPTAAPVECLVGPVCEHGELVVLIEVPLEDRSNPADDIADAYAVECGPIPGGCIIWGRYRGQWIANVSGRWLLSRFVRHARMMMAYEHSGGDGWWQGCNEIIKLVDLNR